MHSRPATRPEVTSEANSRRRCAFMVGKSILIWTFEWTSTPSPSRAPPYPDDLPSTIGTVRRWNAKGRISCGCLARRCESHARPSASTQAGRRWSSRIGKERRVRKLKLNRDLTLLSPSFLFALHSGRESVWRKFANCRSAYRSSFDLAVAIDVALQRCGAKRFSTSRHVRFFARAYSSSVRCKWACILAVCIRNNHSPIMAPEKSR